MIELRAAGLRMGGRTLLEDFSLSLPDPGIYSLTGPTGSGKTIVGMLLCGLLRPGSGQVLIDGSNMHRLFRLQQPALWYFGGLDVPAAGQSVEDYVATLATESGMRRGEINLLLTRCAALLACPASLDAGQLSSGQLAALQIIAASLLPMRLIVLDGQFGLLDSELAEGCLNLLHDGLAGKETAVLLCQTRQLVCTDNLVASWRLTGGLPVRLADEEQHSQEVKRGAASTVLRLRLRGGHRPGLGYQSGRSYRVLGLMEGGLRIEVLGAISAVLEELSAAGLVLEGLDWE